MFASRLTKLVKVEKLGGKEPVKFKSLEILSVVKEVRADQDEGMLPVRFESELMARFDS